MKGGRREKLKADGRMVIKQGERKVGKSGKRRLKMSLMVKPIMKHYETLH